MLSYPQRILNAVIAGILLFMVSISVSADTEVWRLDLATESGEVSPEAFPAWM